MADHPVAAKPSRRNLFKATIVGAGVGVLSVRAGTAAAWDGYGGTATGTAPNTTPFVEPLPVSAPKQALSVLNPPATEFAQTYEAGRDPHQRWATFPPQKFYEVHVTEQMHSFHRELPNQPIWGYDGSLPGPTLVARVGEPVVVRFYNELVDAIYGFGSPELSTHLHNAHAASESDGFTTNYYSKTKFGPTISRAGAFYDNHYPNCYSGFDLSPSTNGDAREGLGTMWYHDHRVDFTAANVYRGLAGFYLLFDSIDSGNENDTAPGALRLPSGVGQYDIPLMFSDPRFDSVGARTFDQFDVDGFLGNKYAVNGKIQPYFNVARRKYRFRLLNGSPARFYELYLVSGAVDQSFYLIATDGNLLPAPLTMTKARIAPAERADLVIDFSKYPIGSKLYFVNRMVQSSGRGPDGVQTPGDQVLQFIVDRDAIDYSQVPSTLRKLAPLNISEAVANRSFMFEKRNGAWVINGATFDAGKPAFTVKRGTAEVWTLQGGFGWVHPIHIHMDEGRIISRNGVPPPPELQGRKDIFVLYPNDTVKVLIRFRDFLGKYMMHCHNTVHEDHAMMLRFDVVV